MVPEMYAKARGEKRLRGPTKIAQDPSAHVSSPKLMALITVYNLSLVSWIMRMRELLFHHWLHGATQQEKKIFLKRSTGLQQFLGYENGLR